MIEYLVLFRQYIPSLMEVALERLTRESKTTDMRRMCLQVVRLEMKTEIVGISFGALQGSNHRSITNIHT